VADVGQDFVRRGCVGADVCGRGVECRGWWQWHCDFGGVPVVDGRGGPCYGAGSEWLGRGCDVEGREVDGEVGPGCGPAGRRECVATCEESVGDWFGKTGRWVDRGGGQGFGGGVDAVVDATGAFGSRRDGACDLIGAALDGGSGVRGYVGGDVGEVQRGFVVVDSVVSEPSFVLNDGRVAVLVDSAAVSVSAVGVGPRHLQNVLRRRVKAASKAGLGGWSAAEEYLVYGLVVGVGGCGSVGSDTCSSTTVVNGSLTTAGLNVNSSASQSKLSDPANWVDLELEVQSIPIYTDEVGVVVAKPSRLCDIRFGDTV